MANCSVPDKAMETAVSILLSLEFGMGITNNAIALWIFFFRLKIWKPHVMYLLNLMIADILLNICLPLRLIFFVTQMAWDFKDTLCRVVLFVLSLSQAVSIAFLTAVAVERYIRVVHPHNNLSFLTTKTVKVIASLVWLLAMGLTVEILFSPQHQNTKCRSFSLHGETNFRTIGHDVIFFLKLLIPFSLILFCTTGIIKKLRKSRNGMKKQPGLQKAKLLLITVVVVFGVCFLPSMLGRMLTYILQSSENCAAFHVAVHVTDVTVCWSYLNSAIDPIVYCFSSPTFQHSYRKFIHSIRLKRNEAEPQSLDISKDSET
uniref:G protein-coupled receptor 31 n=1 Tax=Crocodylus porosus TaxID=8502 RepID=A0A7M4FHX2_CROPO